MTSKKILFLLEPHFAPRTFYPKNLMTDSRGLTGSEVTLFMLASELADHGHDVTIFSTFAEKTKFRNVVCEPHSFFSFRAGEAWDAAIAWMQPVSMQQLKHVPIRLMNQQVNDFDYCPGWETYCTHATSPSQHHMEFLKKITDFKNWHVLPNGIDVSLYPEVPYEARKLGRMVYASSPDRGLHWVLEAFPFIKKAVPHATLDIYYNWDNSYNEVVNMVGEVPNRLRYILESIKRMQSIGVTHHRSVSRTEIAKIMGESQILPYPCSTVRYTEGFSVTTLEAAVSGCLPILVGTDALESIYQGYVPMVKAPYHKNRDEWINLVIEYLSNKELYVSAQKKARELADIYSWKKLGDQLENILFH